MEQCAMPVQDDGGSGWPLCCWRKLCLLQTKALVSKYDIPNNRTIELGIESKARDLSLIHPQGRRHPRVGGGSRPAQVTGNTKTTRVNYLLEHREHR